MVLIGQDREDARRGLVIMQCRKTIGTSVPESRLEDLEEIRRGRNVVWLGAVCLLEKSL